jgi:hypothetical protein
MHTCPLSPSTSPSLPPSLPLPLSLSLRGPGGACVLRVQTLRDLQQQQQQRPESGHCSGGGQEGTKAGPGAGEEEEGEGASRAVGRESEVGVVFVNPRDLAAMGGSAEGAKGGGLLCLLASKGQVGPGWPPAEMTSMAKPPKIAVCTTVT